MKSKSLGLIVLFAAWGIFATAFGYHGYSFQRNDFKHDKYTVSGIKEGKYYIHCEVEDEGHGKLLHHKGKIVDFTRGGPWFERDGKNFMIRECDPIEVKNGDVFKVDHNTVIRRITLSEKPLSFAPQKLFTRVFNGSESYSFNIEYGEKDFTVKIANIHSAPLKGKVSIVMTDYWQCELARMEKSDVDLTSEMKFTVPFSENPTGYCLVRVEVEDVDGRKESRIFTRLTDKKNAFREEVRMNAGWERTYIEDDGTRASRILKKDPPQNAKWQKVEFPSEILGSVSWFKRMKTLPESFAGRKIFFKVSRMVGHAELYIDGEKVYEFNKDFNFNGNQEVDITKFAKPGVKQEYLLVSRQARYVALEDGELDKKVPDMTKIKVASALKSAWEEVSIEARPEKTIGRVKVVTSVRNGAISVSADHPEGYTLKNIVSYKGEKQLEFTDSAKWENPVLWGPFEFPLLKLETQLIDSAGNVVDIKETRFGFREFRGEKTSLMWNGHHVRGDARAFMSTWGWQFDRRCKRQHNVDSLFDAKKRGVKFIRHIYNGSNFIDYCDELGLVVAKGGVCPAGPTPEKNANDDFWKNKEFNDRVMIESLYNHPSIMTWYLSNEYYAESEDANWKRISSAVKHALSCDSTRFAEGGCDIDVRKTSNIISTHYPVEVHAFRNPGCFMPYCFYWRPIDRMFEEGMRVPFGQVKKVCNVFADSAITWGEKPIVVNETCWDYFFAPPFGYTRIAGDEPFEQIDFNYKWHMVTSKEAVRGHRDAETTLWTTWRWYSSDDVSYVSPEIDIVPIQRYSHFYEGTKVSYDVNAFYDVWKPAELVWFWRLENSSGETVAGGIEDVRKVDTAALYREKIVFDAPAAGKYVLRCGFKGVREIATDITVYAKKSFVVPSNVIAADESLSTNLLVRAASGETIVILARDEYPEWLPEMMSLTEQYGAILQSFRKSHPILRNVDDEELKYFYPDSVACKRAFMKPSAGNAKTIIEFGGPSGLTYSALVEVPYGKGCFIYSRLILEPDVNPVAAKLLENISSYRRTDVSGKALYVKDGNKNLAKTLRVRCNAELEEGDIGDVAKYSAVFLDGSRKLSAEELTALENCGKTVFVFSPGPQWGVKTRRVKVKDWQGRAVRVGCDKLIEGLTNQDFMWRSKYEESKTAAGNLGEVEMATEEGAMLYPVYLARRGNIVFVTADPSAYNASVATLQKRFWATLFGNAGVSIKPFEKPSLPKNLFYSFVDISKYFDRTLDDEVENDGKGSWNDQGPKQALPMKFKYSTGWVGGVPFDVKQSGPCAFALETENRIGGMSNVTIQIGRKADTIHWLYSSGWTAKGMRHFTVRVKYDDGSESVVYGQGGVNMQDWVAKAPDFSEETDTVSAYKSFRTGHHVFETGSVFSMSYVNPKPDKVIREIVFERGEKYCARVGVFALTLGSKKSEYAGMPQAEKESLHAELVAGALKAQEEKNFVKAIGLYEKAIRVVPEKVWVYRSIGAIYESLKDWDYALTTYRRSLEADYNQPDIWEAEKRVKKHLGIK